jgi:Secretion system C-terminal sorting domain
MKFLTALCLLCSSVSSTYSQTQFWADNFEGAPTSGTRTPEENGGTAIPSTSYFKLTDGSTVLQAVSFTGKQGTNYWAGEDHNAAGTGFTASGAQGAATNSPNNELQIEWTGIDISGKSGLSFRGLLAANSTNEPWDNTIACISGVGTTNTDYIIVEYRIDGGPYTSLIRFYNRGSASGTGDKYLFEDTDNNNCGDGTQLVNTFAEFTKPIAGTGTILNLRIRVYCEGNNEEWGIDNFRLFYTSALPVTITQFNGQAKNNSNQLSWTTATELNSSHFEIEKSADGTLFKKIGSVQSKGSTTNQQHYLFTDNATGNTAAFYRLKQVDNNGHFEYSKTIRVNAAAANGFTVYPNPVTNTLQVVLAKPLPQNSAVTLTDINGKNIPVLFNGTGSYRSCNMKHLPSGLYLLKIITDDGVQLKTITKQ